MITTDLSYPIGKVSDQLFTGKGPYDDKLKTAALRKIELLPQLLEFAILNLDEAQLNTPYRPDGWTVKQVVHHVADSHMNAFIRFKLGLTEDNPTIKPYDQDAWVKTKDVSNIPINVSLTLLHSLHIRLYTLLNHIKSEDWQRTIFHPEQQKELSLWSLLAIYSWHGEHHAAHITQLRKRMNW